MNVIQEEVRDCLARLAAANGGRLTPEIVVREARDKTSPLHPHFEWDVKKAAAAHWIDQARELIRSVRVSVQTTETTVRAPFYVRDPAAGPGVQGYVAVSRIRSDADAAREVLLHEFRAVADRLNRAREVAVALDLDNEVEGLIRNLGDLRGRLQGPAAAQ